MTRIYLVKLNFFCLAEFWRERHQLISGFYAGCFQHTVIEEWLAWLRGSRKCSPESCNNRLVSLRTFLKYLGSRDAAYLHFYLEAAQIPSRKCLKKKVDGLTREAVKALMDAPDLSVRTGRRDMAFLILLYSTVVRLDEILSMRNSQLHMSEEKAYAVIIGKGSKIRTLYLLPKVVAHLNRYLREFHGETPDPETYVFYSRNTGSHGKMTQPAISKMLKKYTRTVHESCSNVPLGHANLETSLIYAYADTEQKRRAIEKSMGRKVAGGIDIPRLTISDEDTIKRLYGLK